MNIQHTEFIIKSSGMVTGCEKTHSLSVCGYINIVSYYRWKKQSWEGSAKIIIVSIYTFQKKISMKNTCKMSVL